MAVYTHVSHEQLETFLKSYDLGKLVSHEGIEKGVSNTNYHVFTKKGRYILTLFEERRVKAADLPFFFAFADHLGEKGILCPQVIADRSGNTVGQINGRAACLLSFLQGHDLDKADITPDACAKMGRFLARMHVAADGFGLERPNSIGLEYWHKLTDKVLPFADECAPGLADMLKTELGFLEMQWPEDLPRGAVHADVFPDNVFWEHGHVHAVIDFYFACTDFYAFDLAICLNAWCFDADWSFSSARYLAMIKAYEAVRPLNGKETQALRTLCRGAVFRTLISRLEEYFEHDPKTTLMAPHDPREYLAKLKFHQEEDIRYV